MFASFAITESKCVYAPSRTCSPAFGRCHDADARGYESLSRVVLTLEVAQHNKSDEHVQASTPAKQRASMIAVSSVADSELDDQSMARPRSRSKLRRKAKKRRLFCKIFSLHITVFSQLINGATRRLTLFLEKTITSGKSTEGRTIFNFGICLQDARGRNYQDVLRDMRQFLDGLRRFITGQHGNYHKMPILIQHVRGQN